jgi:2-phospho-L-lactate transferase/gluconeogenesis factor (CofD/UPF0052 family)
LNSQENKIRVVVFSGGRGAGEIISAFHDRPDVSLSILVNGYDDGKSTGIIRTLFPELLGPSDFRKVISNILNSGDDARKSLSELLEFRLSNEHIDGKTSLVLENMDKKLLNVPNLSLFINGFMRKISREMGDYVTELLESGLRAFITHPKFQPSLLIDMSVGNLFILGSWLEANQNFNLAIEKILSNFSIQTKILNVNDGTSLYLVAIKKNGQVLWNESEIVSKQTTSTISDLLLFKHDVSSKFRNFNLSAESGITLELLSSATIPVANQKVWIEISSADIIVYGPGTQNSSLFPSYVTEGVGQKIAANRESMKFFIANIDEDLDIQGENLGSLLQQFSFFMNRNSKIQLDVPDLIDYALINASDTHSDSWILSGFQKKNFAPSIAIGSWANSERRHSGDRVVRSVLSLFLQKNSKAVKTDFDSVSVVIPVLNEIKTLRKVIEEISTYDWLEHNILMDITVVDGGSEDGSLDYLRELPQLRVIELPSGTGRGTAISVGLKSSSGRFAITYPADNEYTLDGLLSCINMLRNSLTPIVFGSRAPFCIDSDLRLKQIYKGKRREYFQSKWGGLLISFLLATLYKRWISDPLTSIKGFRSDVLNDLSLTQAGIDWDTQVIMDARSAGLPIVEVPVEYLPRNRNEGKKTKPIDGIPLLLKLIAGRFKSARRTLS